MGGAIERKTVCANAGRYDCRPISPYEFGPNLTKSGILGRRDLTKRRRGWVYNWKAQSMPIKGIKEAEHHFTFYSLSNRYVLDKVDVFVRCAESAHIGK